MNDGRNALFGGHESSGRKPYRDEPDSFRGNDAGGIMGQQQHIMREQDQGLDLISQSIARQKEMAFKIGDEIEDQVRYEESQHITRLCTPRTSA